MIARVIEILDGIVHEVPDVQDTASKFVNTLIDSVELVQLAERLCPDDELRLHIHLALLHLTSAVAEAAPRVMPGRVR